MKSESFPQASAKGARQGLPAASLRATGGARHSGFGRMPAWVCALAMMAIWGDASAQPQPAQIQIFYRLDPWLISGNYGGGFWASPPIFGPVTQGAATFVLQLSAQGLDAQGQSVVISPQWVSSDPGVAAVSPTQGTQVLLTVQNAGRSTLTAAYQGVFKQLLIIAGFQNGALLVEIDQQALPSAAPLLTAAPSILTFSHQSGGPMPAPQNLNLGSVSGAVAFNVSTSAAWLLVSPKVGLAPVMLSVSVNPQGLTVGQYSGTITITPTVAGGPPVSVTVVLNVTDTPKPLLLTMPAALNFFTQTGSPIPIPQTVSILSNGAQLAYKAAVSTGANWLSVTPASGNTPDTLNVQVTPIGLPAGQYTGSISISSPSAANSLENISVNLTIAPPPPGPLLSISPAAVTFTYITGDKIPPAKKIVLTTKPSPAAFWISTALQPSGSWLAVSPTSGNTPAELTVGVNPAGLAPGTYSGTVNVTAAGAVNGPQTVNVTLIVTAPASTAVPNLSFAFAVTDRQASGSNIMLLSGSGKFGPADIQGEGSFVEVSSARPPSVVRHGHWTANRLLSFIPTQPLAKGGYAGGILTFSAVFSVEHGEQIPAVLTMVANVPSQGLVTGQPGGVTVAITGGATYTPTDIGIAILRPRSGRDD